MTTRVNMKKFEAMMKKVIGEVESKETMQELGDEMAERIRKRTRLGKGVSERGGAPKPLAPLSQSYKDFRKGKVAFAQSPYGHVYPYKPDRKPNLSSQTSANKSNLTFTGQMLDSIKTISAKVGSAIVSVSGRRKDGMSNKEVAEFVSVARPFLNLSKPELNALQKLIRQRIDRILKRS
jgi:hypothetical protein